MIVVPRQQNHEDSDIAIIDKQEIKIPKKYKVIMHNDDYTTMEFVIYVLKRFFHKKQSEAQQIMMDIHTKGAAICGIYTLDIAKTKCRQVGTEARKQQFPLKVTWEQE